MSKAPRRGRRLHGKSAVDDVDRELAFHIETRTRELVDAGMDESLARTEALRLFGDYGAIRGDCTKVAERHARARKRTTMLTEFVQDLRYAARWLIREPAFTLIAVITLALGIGANTAAFTMVNGVLLAPLPYPQADRLVAVWEQSETGAELALAWPNFADWRAGSSTLADLAAYQPPYRATVLGAEEPVYASVAHVSANLFSTLAVPPLRGRTFDPALVPGAPAEVVVSEGFWRTRLGAEPDLSRLQLETNGTVAQVVGVMAARFDFPRDVEIWFPLDVVEPSNLGTRSAHNFRAVGRLADGASIATAVQELSALTSQMRQQDPETDATGAIVHDLREDHVADSRRALLILLGASGFVLLVACTNLASALLGRAARRRPELAIRAALGAPRLRLLRQLLTESLLLATVGAVAGLLLAHLLVRAAVVIGPDAVPRLAEVQVDGWVLAFTSLLAIATAILFGTAPALRATTVDPFDAMRGRGTNDTAQRRGWSMLVGAEVALAVLLLVGSGLLIRSFHRLTQVDPGFDVEQQLAIDVSLPGSKYAEPYQRVQLYDALLERMESVPGVEHASVSMTLPLVTFDPGGTFYRDDDRSEGTGSAHYRVVAPGFFETMRTPLIRGRAFTAADRAGAQDVVIINERMAEQYFSDVDPIGRRILTGGMDTRGEVPAIIIGIAGDVLYRGLDAPAPPGYYLPYAQRPDRIANMTLLVRTAGNPAALSDEVRHAVRELDPDIALSVATLSSRVGESFATRRFLLFVLGTFAAIALLLSAVGIYGVVSFAVARRTREIGIRVALGEATHGVLWTVSRGTMVSVGAGLVVGLVAAALLSRLIASLLFEVEPVDPLTFVTVALLLAATAWLAVLVPARRATRISPITALRAE